MRICMNAFQNCWVFVQSYLGQWTILQVSFIYLIKVLCTVWVRPLRLLFNGHFTAARVGFEVKRLLYLLN